MDNYRQTQNHKHRHFVVVGDVVVELEIVIVVGISVVIVNVDLNIDIENFCPLRSFHRCISLYLNDTRICPASAQSAKGLLAESARGVTGRRCLHSGMGENLVPLTITGVTRKRKVAQ